MAFALKASVSVSCGVERGSFGCGCVKLLTTVQLQTETGGPCASSAAPSRSNTDSSPSMVKTLPVAYRCAIIICSDRLFARPFLLRHGRREVVCYSTWYRTPHTPRTHCTIHSKGYKRVRPHKGYWRVISQTPCDSLKRSTSVSEWADPLLP